MINMKFSPANVAGEEGTRRLMQMIRTWSELKHWHVQFNILNRETLIEAQKNPEITRNIETVANAMIEQEKQRGSYEAFRNMVRGARP